MTTNLHLAVRKPGHELQVVFAGHGDAIGRGDYVIRQPSYA